MQAFLQRQSSVQARLLSRAAPAKRQVPEGVLSPALAQYALLPGPNTVGVSPCSSADNARTVEIYDVATGQLARSLDLPELSSYPLLAPVWVSDASSTHLLLCSGGAWLTPEKSPLWSLDNRKQAGLLFVDVQTGAHNAHELPAQAADWEDTRRRVIACPGPPRVLVVHSAGEDEALSVIDCRGTRLHRCRKPRASMSSFVWAPDGQAIAIFGCDSGSVWELSGRRVVHLGVRGSWAVWATPASDCLLVGESVSKRIARYAAHEQPAKTVLTQQHFPEAALSIAWGDRLALLVSTSSDAPTGYACSELQVFAVQTGELTLERSFSIPARRFELWGTALSADGRLWAGLTHAGQGLEHCLAVVQLAAGCLREFELPGGGWQAVRFSLDCCSVLVSGQDGRSHLFSFAADPW